MWIADQHIGITNDYIHTTKQTFRFLDDEDTIHEHRPAFDTMAAMVGDENKQHSIADFLARPIQLKTFEWGDSATATSNIFRTGLMEGIKNHNNYSKLVGFRYFRADVEITVVVNSQPFQQGALLISYFPLGSDNEYQYSQTVSLTGRTGTLSTVLNVEDDAPTSLYVPFNHPAGYIDLVNPPDRLLGTVNIDVYVQSGPGPITGTVFIRYLNVKLLGPTSELPHTNFVPPGMSVSAQMGDFYIPPLYAQTSEAEQQSNSGIVTAVSGAVKTAADALGQFSILKPITTPLSWVAGCINKVAMYFGWSKPISLHTTNTVKQTTSRYMANFNGVDTSDALSLDADNKVDQFAFFGEEDVMSIDSMVTRLNYISTTSISVGGAVGTSLLKLHVHPFVGATFTKSTKNDGKYSMHISSNVTYLAYISSMFRYWNGTIRFQLRIIKTKFHSGRLLLSWKPGTVGKADVTSVPMAYSIVWDIAKNNTIVVDVPYMNPKPWLQVMDVQAKISTNSVYNVDCHNGMIEVAVLNKIVASSDQVKKTLDLVVEVAAAPGFNLAFPRDSRLMPITNKSVDSTRSSRDVSVEQERVDDPIYAPDALHGQIGMMAKPVNIVPDGSRPIPLGPERLSIGEKVTSLRQLIKRFVPYYAAGDLATNKFPSSHDDIRNMYQYEVPTVSAKSTVCVVDPTNLAFAPKIHNEPVSGNTNASVIRTDQLTLIGGMFAYYRGGMRFKALPVSTTLASTIENQMFITSLIDPGPYQLFNFPKVDPVSLIGASNPTILTNRSTGSVIEVQVPYYSKYAYTPCRVRNGLDGPNSPETQQFVMYAYGDKTNVTYVPIHYRAAADDFEFIFPIGVPLVQFIHHNLVS